MQCLQKTVCEMKNSIILLTLFILLPCACMNKPEKQAVTPVRIIFDTDLGPDYDDVGALAFLHAMEDSGKVQILATIASNKNELVAPCIEIINTYFGKPGLPVGAPSGEGPDMSSSQHWPDSLVKYYPHNLRSTGEAEDAVTLYRRILAAQPDSSVTIVTVGFLTNLAGLLKSPPDLISDLTGTELVALKVRNYVAMAGWFPQGREFNVFIDSVASEYVLNEWPGRIIFSGFETGSRIFTGVRLVNSGVSGSPVRDVFRISLPLSEQDKNGRMSWDQTAVLIAVYGTEGFFETRRGNIIVRSDGSNSWEDDPAGKHSYVVQKMSIPEMTKFIEDRMMHIPVKK